MILAKVRVGVDKHSIGRHGRPDPKAQCALTRTETKPVDHQLPELTACVREGKLSLSSGLEINKISP